MKATFPHMGNNWICFKGMLDALGIDTVLPPAISQRTVELGVRNSPEFVCFPFKLNMGNFIEAMEQGADTLLMAGGSQGTCRFQNYSYVQRQILEDLGYKFNLIVINTNNILESFLGSVRELNPANSKFDVIKAFFFMAYKAKVLSEIEDLRRYKLPRELLSGETETAAKEALQSLDKAKSFKQVKKLRLEIRRAFSSVRERTVNLVRIGLIGEIYTVSEPAINLDIEKELAERGAEVYNPMSFYRWLKVLAKIDFHRNRLAKIAAPFLKVKTGGEDQQSIGYMIEFARRGFEGAILLHPFTCLPENIAKSAINRIICAYNMPVLSLALDEHTSKEAMATRLEAFIDLIKRRKSSR